jgi:monofunctional biosynthetic peptidoglycan transglycosylase
MLALIVVLGGFIALLTHYFMTTPDFTKLRGPFEMVFNVSKTEKIKKMTGPGTSNWVSLSNISNSLILTILASEDSSFYSHKGVDFHEIKEALKKDIKEKKWARGASTITQQVVKNIYLSQEKTLTRKLREVIWARAVETVLSKNEILELYLNIVEWGPNIFGIKAATQYYFSKPPSQLTLKESAFLALLLPSPKKYHSYFAKKELTDFSHKRIQSILNIMYKLHYITEEELTQSLAEPLWEKDTKNATEYFIEQGSLED